MWRIINNTPFAAERCWVRDKDGAEVWLVAVRGTFLIGANGSTKPAEEQEPVVMAPKYRGEPEKSALLYESDLLHTKVATDVILHGHAYSPGNKPATEMDVSLKVAEINKKLRVIGDRVWENSKFGLKLTRPQQFTKMPITYERAYGGAEAVDEKTQSKNCEPRNPVGTGFPNRPEHLDGKTAPNVEDPDSSRQTRPVGFGPIAGHWQPRLKFAGTYDAKWEKERMPLFPEDFDERFYQCAPQDQQVPGFLKGGELVELQNLTPSGVLKFRLPWVSFRFRSYFAKGGDENHRGVLHSVILEPDIPRVIMVWHTQLPCHHKVHKLTETTIHLLRRINVPKQDYTKVMWTGVED